MATQIMMPQLGLTMTEGTVSKWLKQVGDQVQAGDLLVEVSTDKITNQIEASISGVLLKIVVQEGQVVPVKSVLAYIGEMGEKVDETEAVSAEGEEEIVPAEVKPEEIQKSGSVTPTDRVKISPRARKMAAERGITAGEIIGTGPDGRIVARDVEGYVAKPTREKISSSPLARKIADEHGVDINKLEKDGRIMSQDVLAQVQSSTVSPLEGTALSGMRKVIADRLSQSWQQAPHVHMTVEVNMSEAMALKYRLQEKMNVKISFTELVVKACALAIKEFPQFNEFITDGKVFTSPTINIGMAVAIDNGLVVPVIKDAYGKSLLALRQEIAELGGKAREGRLTPDHMSGGTFTVSNLGMYEVDHFTPVINPPESAILGVCRTVEKPVVICGEICICPMMNLVMSFDHRLIDGAVGAQFMRRLRQLLEEPLLMI